MHDTTSIPACAGIDHADFSVDGRTAVFTCEFAGRVVVVDVASHRVLRTVDMPVKNTMMGPQDIKLGPDGRVYYIADSDSNGVWVLDKDLKVDIAASGGPGGQNVNKVATAVTLRHRPSGISVTAQDSRSQAMNRRLARQRQADASGRAGLSAPHSRIS